MGREWAPAGRARTGLVSCLHGQGLGARPREGTASSGVSLDIGSVVSVEIFIRAACQSGPGLLQGQQSAELVGWASLSLLIGPYISFRGTGKCESCLVLLFSGMTFAEWETVPASVLMDVFCSTGN